jgi:hypothetical protein
VNGAPTAQQATADFGAAAAAQRATQDLGGAAAAAGSAAQAALRRAAEPAADSVTRTVKPATDLGASTGGGAGPAADLGGGAGPALDAALGKATSPPPDPVRTAVGPSSTGGPASPAGTGSPARSERAPLGLARRPLGAPVAPRGDSTADPLAAARRAGRVDSGRVAPVAGDGASTNAWHVMSAVSLFGATPGASHGENVRLSPPTSPARDDRLPGPERLPLPIGGAVASGAALTFSLGGLAILAIALCLASPCARRRLLVRPAMCRPTAFVPLLERPG